MRKARVIEQYLGAEVELLRRHRAQPRHRYWSLGHFVLQHGRAWPTRRYECGRGAVKECFRNAALLALEDPGLVYVEGYALGIIPVLHAWCVTRDGSEVAEVTWPEMGTEYYGIPFRREYLHSRLERYRMYGLIDQYERGFPILSEEPAEWRHPRFMKKDIAIQTKLP